MPRRFHPVSPVTTPEWQGVFTRWEGSVLLNAGVRARVVTLSFTCTAARFHLNGERFSPVVRDVFTRIPLGIHLNGWVHSPERRSIFTRTSARFNPEDAGKRPEWDGGSPLQYPENQSLILKCNRGLPAGPIQTRSGGFNPRTAGEHHRFHGEHRWSGIQVHGSTHPAGEAGGRILSRRVLFTI